jgi:hypothetical protein
MNEFNNLTYYHDTVNDVYLNVREAKNGCLYLEIHERIGEKYCSLVLTKTQALQLTQDISEHYK